MICPKCSEKNDDEDKFCKKCGSKLNSKKSEPSKNPSTKSSSIKHLENKNVLLVMIIIIAIIIAILGILSLMGTNDNSYSNDSGELNNDPYTYIEGVPFYIPNYYTHTSTSNEDGVYSEVYINNQGEEISITATHSTSASAFASHMNGQGYNFKYDSSRNLYYLSHPTMNGYIFDYGDVTIYIYADNLDDLHTAYILD